MRGLKRKKEIDGVRSASKYSFCPRDEMPLDYVVFAWNLEQSQEQQTVRH